jgi:hypothetical protein
METFKKYAISSAITFFASFAIIVVANIDDITAENIGTSAFISVIFAAVRAGVKAVLENFIDWYNNR